MEEHRKFLADRLLSEERPITYRLLSRALDVHVTTAKEMLFDFHRYQNEQRKDSIHATYMIYGIKGTQQNGDIEMASSMPEHDSLTDIVRTSTLTVVAEPQLEATLKQYTTVDSIHMYSLAPNPQRDALLLSELTKSLLEYPTEDPLASAEKFGAIINPNVRRRVRGSKPQAEAPKPVGTAGSQVPPAKNALPSTKAPASASAPAAAKIKQEAAQTASKDSTPTSSAGKAAPPPLKRGGSGSIMQSFAKAAAKPPKPKKEEEDTPMSDDGEADDDDIPAAKKKADNDAENLRKTRKEREAELKRMMEEEDDEEEDEEASGKDDDKEDEEMEEPPEPEPEPEPQPKEENNEPAEVVSSSGDGRRRGKRRIMKKKRQLDDQGYMVTIQEPGWESFSEDEAPPAKKPTPSSTPSSSGTKSKKPAGKPGQGNIMSFFSKK